MREGIELPDGRQGMLIVDLPVRPSSGQVYLQRWGMKGAKASSSVQMLVDDQQAVYMDLVPQPVIVDGMKSVYQEIEQRYLACVIGGLVTRAGFKSRGYATAMLTRLVELLQEREPRFECICNFVLDERLTFFVERGWQAVDKKKVKVTIQQPGETVVLPERFTLMLLPLQNSFCMPEETFEYMGLPA